MGMMDIFLRSKKSPDQLAEIEAKIAAVEAELRQHNVRLPGEIIAKLQGDPNAAARVEATKAAIADLERQSQDLRAAAGALRAKIIAAEAAEHRSAVEARPKNVAELRREYMHAVNSAYDHARGLAVSLRAISRAAEGLSAEMDSAPVRRFLALDGRMKRFQSGVARLFAINPERALTVSNSLLGIPSYEVGARSHLTVIDHEEQGLDDLVPIFENQAAAEAARDRLAARGQKLVDIGLPGGVFILTPIEDCFATHDEAQRQAAASATRGTPKAIIAHEGAWVLVDARFAVNAG